MKTSKDDFRNLAGEWEFRRPGSGGTQLSRVNVLIRESPDSAVIEGVVDVHDNAGDSLQITIKHQGEDLTATISLQLPPPSAKPLKLNAQVSVTDNRLELRPRGIASSDVWTLERLK